MSDAESSASISVDTEIPINHASPPEVIITRTAPGSITLTGLEREMDGEVEQVFREWDENLKCRTQSSFQVRPTKKSAVGSTSAAEKRRRRFPTSVNTTSKSVGDVPATRFEFPDIDIIRREDATFNTSTDSLEDDARRQFYMESPISGKRMYHMEFDVAGYEQENISVKVSGSRLIVHAVQQETDTGRKSTTEFCRKVKLPSDVDVHKLHCTCVNGRLVLEAPAPKQSPLSGAGTPTFPVTSPKVEPLNKPIFKNVAPLGKCMSLTVELGRVFRADDVLVKVKSQNRLVVQAQREEKGDKSKMSASMVREFDLEERIIPQSLKAGLTTDGLLKVTAQAMVEVRIITNGMDEEEDEDQGAEGTSDKVTNGHEEPEKGDGKVSDCVQELNSPRATVNSAVHDESSTVDGNCAHANVAKDKDNSDNRDGESDVVQKGDASDKIVPTADVTQAEIKEAT